MISSLEMEATLGRTKAAISPRVRRLTRSSLNTKFWLEGALSGGLVALIRSNCFVDLSTGVASVLFITAGAVVAADVTEAIVAVLLLPCCCGVAAAFGDPMAACALLLTCCGAVPAMSLRIWCSVASFTLIAVLLYCCGTGDGMSFLNVCSHSSCWYCISGNCPATTTQCFVFSVYSYSQKSGPNRLVKSSSIL